MFARLTHFFYDPAEGEAFDEIHRPFGAMLGQQPGFQSVLWLQREEELAVLSLWDTREHAEAVTAAVRDKLIAALADASVNLTRLPGTTIYEVRSQV